MNQVQERICELENRNFVRRIEKRKNRNYEIIQSEENNKKRMRKSKESPPHLWGTIRRNNL